MLNSVGFIIVEYNLTVKGVTKIFSKEVFGQRLAMLRKGKGVTAPVLGEIVGITKSAISRFEHGKDYPHCETLVALADYFDVSLDYLIGRSDDPVRR